MAGKTISVSTANDMISKYSTYMQSLKVNMGQQTHSVSFTNDALMEWLGSVKPHIDEIRIFMGVYPENHAQAGRTTVILWPYKNDKPATKPLTQGKGNGDEEDLPPFNEGGGRP